MRPAVVFVEPKFARSLHRIHRAHEIAAEAPVKIADRAGNRVHIGRLQQPPQREMPARGDAKRLGAQLHGVAIENAGDFVWGCALDRLADPDGCVTHSRVLGLKEIDHLPFRRGIAEGAGRAGPDFVVGGNWGILERHSRIPPGGAQSFHGSIGVLEVGAKGLHGRFLVAADLVEPGFVVIPLAGMAHRGLVAKHPVSVFFFQVPHQRHKVPFSLGAPTGRENAHLLALAAIVKLIDLIRVGTPQPGRSPNPDPGHEQSVWMNPQDVIYPEVGRGEVERLALLWKVGGDTQGKELDAMPAGHLKLRQVDFRVGGIHALTVGLADVEKHRGLWLAVDLQHRAGRGWLHRHLQWLSRQAWGRGARDRAIGGLIVDIEPGFMGQLFIRADDAPVSIVPICELVGVQ